MGKIQGWALGTIEGSPREIEILSRSGESRVIPLEEAVGLAAPGMPKPRKRQRHVFEGDFAGWAFGSAKTYLTGIGLALPAGVRNRQEVYTFPVNEKLTAHVPAWVLMTAFFKPHKFVLPAVFHPVSLDLLSFVSNYESPPVVTLDGLEILCKAGFRSQNSVSRERAIQWCQLSVSARAMSWSVFRHALSGRLALTLPQGQVRIVLHGVRQGRELFVTQAALSYVVVSSEDSLTGQQEQYVFHAGADHTRQRYASVKGLSIPAKPDGEYQVSDEEWELLAPKFPRSFGGIRYSYREVLDWIILKIGSGVPWKNLTGDPKLVGAVKAAFRTWSADGRMGIALEVLTTSRCAGEGVSLSGVGTSVGYS